MSTQPLIDDLHSLQYTQSVEDDDVSERSAVHIDVDDMPHVIGIRPQAPREDIPLVTIEAIESFKHHSNISVSNIVWSVLFGWWLGLFYWLTGIILLITVYFYKQGIFCFKYGLYIMYPFGKYVYKTNTNKPPASQKIIWALLSPIYGIPAIVSAGLSWELVYFIPMAKAVLSQLTVPFQHDIETVSVGKLVNHNPVFGHLPISMCHSSGSWFYFRFTVFSFEVVYLNFIPFVILSLIVGFVDCSGTFLDNPILGSIFSLLGAMPCAYLIGICVDDLSKQLGIIVGSILNSTFLSIVELILYFFSLRVGLTNVVRAAVTGCFLMNLLIIPGVAMLAVGLKWKETVLNKKAQSISGTFLLLAIVSVLFPSIFYHIHANTRQDCNTCKIVGNVTLPLASNFNLSEANITCGYCRSSDLDNLEQDPIYDMYASKLMYTMAIIMPFIFGLGMFFSVKTHSHIYENENNEEEGGMSKAVAITVLLLSTVGFSLMAHVMTEKIPHAIEKLHFSERFVGLIFYTLIPNTAEYMNAIKFALHGNIGLSMEIGNQGAILTALVEMPALVLLSFVMKQMHLTDNMFTLVFPLIDIFCVIVAVFLRNSILTEKSINYFTGLSFLLIFLLISVVYYFEFF